MTVEDYSKQAHQWAKALRLLDPTLCLVLCGETGHSTWDYKVLKECIPYVDMHSIHIYTRGPDHLSNVTAPLSAERAIESAAALIDIARIENNIPPSVAKTKICFDEWNVWDPIRAPGICETE
jgi:alpha-N-arabinofuranosidase